MKTKESGWIILLCFFLIVLGCCYFIFSTYQNRIEGLRTVPLPTRHPQPTKYIKRKFPNASGEGMNGIIDSIIGQLFDQNNLVYQDTINMFEMYAVNRGNVSNPTMYKLMDVCYYFLDIVLPNIQTIDNPTPTVSWPKIQWVSNQWLPLDRAYNTIIVSDNAWSYYNIDDVVKKRLEAASAQSSSEGKTIQVSDSDLARLNGIGGMDSDSTNGSSSGGKSGGGCDGTIGGDCQIQCPTSCMSNQFSQDNSTSAKGRPGSFGFDDGTQQQFDWSYFQKMANGFFAGILTDHLDKSLQFQPKYGDGTTRSLGYYITDKPQTSNINVLDQNIQMLIEMLFDKSDAPTQKLLNKFDLYTKAQYPADDIHIEKLKHLIYYVMQRIIPGLPTSDRPTTYVIWKPLT